MDKFGVCLEPDGCMLQHRTMTLNSNSFKPTMLGSSAPYDPNVKTSSQSFDPSKPLPVEQSKEEMELNQQLGALRALGFDVELD